jgi:hypothetical protein
VLTGNCPKPFCLEGGWWGVTDQQRYSHNRPASPGAEQSRPLWQYYIGITALLIVMVVALAGGIIWYNSKKANQLAIAAT